MPRSFKNVVKDIENAEKNVDKVLKAAKLERTPKQGIDSEYLFGIIVIGMLMAFMVLAFVIMRGGV